MAKSNTARKPTGAAAEVKVRTSPFAVMTARVIPESMIKGRQRGPRNEYGWEDLKKVKDFKVIPASMTISARQSLLNFEKSKQAEYEKTKTEAMEKAKAEQGEAFNEETFNAEYIKLMGRPALYATSSTLDENGKPLAHKKDDEFTQVKFDDPEAAPLAKTKTGKAISAFITCMRIQ